MEKNLVEFWNALEGDRVFNFEEGWGTIKKIDIDSFYCLFVHFDESEDPDSNFFTVRVAYK